MSAPKLSLEECGDISHLENPLRNSIESASQPMFGYTTYYTCIYITHSSTTNGCEGFTSDYSFFSTTNFKLVTKLVRMETMKSVFICNP